ncbi:MAG TPA: DsbC family protein [Gammaproteobacteria bacterium]
MSRRIPVLLACLLMFLSAPIALGMPEGEAANDDAIRARIAERFPGVSVDDVTPSPIPGLYEVMMGPIVLYASADGRYLVKGDIYDLETDRNLTESRVNDARARSLDALPDSELVVFGNANADYTVTIFTDVTCSYCRLFHSKIDEYVERGIRVRYAAYPRNGLASDAWQTMEQVWCAKDRQAALTAAKLDQEFETRPSCETDLVMRQWQLGRMLGVRGTPAIFTQSGEMIPGYVPPEQLLEHLRSAARQ